MVASNSNIVANPFSYLPRQSVPVGTSTNTAPVPNINNTTSSSGKTLPDTDELAFNEDALSLLQGLLGARGATSNSVLALLGGGDVSTGDPTLALYGGGASNSNTNPLINSAVNLFAAGTDTIIAQAQSQALQKYKINQANSVDPLQAVLKDYRSAAGFTIIA